MTTTPAPRIAIVGAGPAGLTLAYWLAKLGLESVEIFEAQDEVGGQSVTKDVDGFPVEMGTAYLTQGDALARRIAREVGCPAEVLPPATALGERGEVVAPEAPRTGLLARYLFAWARWYLAGHMHGASGGSDARSFDAWLVDRGFAELAKSFAFTAGMTAQLYGPLDAVSAHSGLSWVRPSLLLTGRRREMAHIPQGFQNLWKRLAEHLGCLIHFSQRVDTIRPIPDLHGRRVELLYEGRRIADLFDHVFLAGPLDRLETHPMKHLHGNPLGSIEHPLSAALRNKFAPFASTEVYSAVWRASHWPEQAPSRCTLPAASSGEVGPLLTIRQFGRFGGGFVGQLCSYAIPDDTSDPSPERDRERVDEHPARLAKNRAKVVSDMERIVGLRNVEIVHERLWRHNVRFSREQIEQRLPGFIDASQGARNVWYTGGTLSHWNVDAITIFNRRLAGRFARRVGLSWRARVGLVQVEDLYRDW